MQLELECDGYHHHHTFDKPFFQSIAMFLAMACVLPLSHVLQPSKKSEGEDKPLLSIQTEVLRRFPQPSPTDVPFCLLCLYC